eukprot:7379160-Prymnesium_polylepis.3
MIITPHVDQVDVNRGPVAHAQRHPLGRYSDGVWGGQCKSTQKMHGLCREVPKQALLDILNDLCFAWLLHGVEIRFRNIERFLAQRVETALIEPCSGTPELELLGAKKVFDTVVARELCEPLLIGHVREPVGGELDMIQNPTSEE